MTNEIITKEMYLKGRDKAYPKEFTSECETNMIALLTKVNKFLTVCKLQHVSISSGFRPESLNSSVRGAANKSNHITCHAVDIIDVTSYPVMRAVLANLKEAEKLGLYFEDFRWTPSWVHIQDVPPKSGNRIYIPSASKALAPNKWDGKV